MNSADDSTVPWEKLLQKELPATAVVVASTALAVPYSHSAMVELMIAHPDYTYQQFAAHFGRGAQWFSCVLSNEDFQSVLAPRKHEVADPGLTATMEERMRALAMQALDVLGKKLESKEVNEQTVLKAVEIGTKALGMGSQMLVLPQAPQVSGAEAVANRILEAMTSARERQAASIKANAVDVEVRVVSSGS